MTDDSDRLRIDLAEEITKNTDLAKQCQDYEHKIESLTALLHSVEVTCQSYKEQYEHEVETNRANKNRILNYMKSTADKIQALQDKNNFYREIFEKIDIHLAEVRDDSKPSTSMAMSSMSVASHSHGHGTDLSPQPTLFHSMTK